MKLFRYRRHLIILILRIVALFFWDIKQESKLSAITPSPAHLQEQTTITDSSEDSPIRYAQESQTSLSLQSIMEWVSQQNRSGNRMISTDKIVALYQKNPSTETASTAIEQLAREFSYNEAYNILEQNQDLYNTLDPELLLRILFNSRLVASKTRNLNNITLTLNQLANDQRITASEKERHLAILGLLEGKKDTFLTIIQSPARDNRYSSTINDIRKQLKKTQQGRDLPAYYEDGIIALSLFEHGYIGVSKELSLKLLKQQPNYILPKQILAYTHIVLHERSEAKSYFLNLINLDPANSMHYQFFVGVSSYWMNKPADTILYISQIDDQLMSSDAVRYLILSYLQLKDYTNAAQQFKILLGKSDIRSSDMLLFWEQAVFEPYSKQQDYAILRSNKLLLSLYIQRCEQASFRPSDSCILWTIAQDIFENKRDLVQSRTLSVISNFPKAYLSLILGESAVRSWQLSQAKEYYITALSQTEDPELKIIIESKLSSLL